MTIAILGVAISFSTTTTQIAFAEQAQVQQQEASITILPIDRAAILYGQKLDFRVELNNGKANKEDIKVYINGVDAETYFGKTAIRTNANGDSSAEFTIKM